MSEWDRKEDSVLLVNKYADIVLRLALAHVGNFADAQDVCQEVFIKLFNYQRPFNDKEHEKAWIIRVTITTCRDVIRSPWKKWFSLVEEVPLPNYFIENMEVLPVVLTLPRKYRVVIHLHYYEGYKTLEIAELLKVKESTIRTQLKRAKELLRAKITGGFANDNRSKL
ncbi:RNA polymerase sigma factor [Paenibacillus sp. L3-i20]|uniref:RNA polymerase sigma factor n=1 Tax=Paenibacillus sp. L3-i20 TaxID=2905833 RepID=UPI001EDE6FF8|nr:sigma-70 family RNA polymerase sigma factor [Paenibacillus sp. L3-i20]